MFYHQTQNNIFGRYVIDLNAGINKNIVIEAKNANQANKRFKKITSTFNGYCECCGSRFYSNFYDGCKNPADNDGKLYPHIYGSDISNDYNKDVSIHYLNGEIENR